MALEKIEEVAARGSICVRSEQLSFPKIVGLNKMEKRMAILSTTGNPEPEIEETDAKVDRITSLPKEVMADILSRLTMETFLDASFQANGDFLGRILEAFWALMHPLNVHRLRFIASDASVNLKCLELRNCHFLKKVEIYAVNLVSLFYNGRYGVPIALNLPHLLELLVGGNYLSQIYHLSQLQIDLSQLESLSFDVSEAKAWPFLKNIPTLSNLKHLELESGITCVSQSFPSFTLLLTAAPFLHTFTLKIMFCLDWPSRESSQTTICSNCSARELSKISLENPHPSFKVVELYGFVRVPAVMEMVFHLLENAPLLEKLMIDPCPPCYLDSRKESRFRESWDYKSAKQQAMELQSKIPPGIEFIVA
ncbi:uncharacterized protein LOC110422836 [Herrania umbratica]|uniref:Uncharacterized protein LOC110422836 n=1 Tax=Herrania umbratica TaxID=108875 RepID=A0A6J1B1K8_9ROSI|nr:uncharacterized protein LOC110422836 [Herrania umbratica]